MARERVGPPGRPGVAEASGRLNNMHLAEPGRPAGVVRRLARRLLSCPGAATRCRKGERMKRTLTPAVAVLAAMTIAGFAPRIAAAASDHCFYKGTMFSDGAQSCQQGSLFRCRDGDWKSQGSACTESESPPTASRRCDLSGISYPTGAASCQNGSQYRCEDGAWRDLATACPGDVAIRVVPGDKTCMYESATVSSNSTICKSGTTFLCSDGEWKNLGTLCR